MNPLPVLRRGIPASIICVMMIVALLGSTFAQHADVATKPVPLTGSDYLRDVRPILAERCFGCHGPDDGTRKARLRLDTREGAFAERRAGRVIAAGRPDESLLIQRVTTDDELDRMPPPDAGEALSEAEIATLRRWIESGAEWSEHWSFVPPQRPPVPAVTGDLGARNAIDHFVHEDLAQDGFVPNGEATREALIRRVTFDLTGLPPTPAEIDAFLADESDDAYEVLVKRLLATPRFGERLAQDWMDLARYADTDGYTYDEPRSVWKWRDWVIGAFNSNKRYDEFVMEQLAGDLLPNATLEQKIATGFNRNHPINSEGGEEEDEYRSKYVIDRANTTATTFMGLTLACAQCHDHKYDPISQKDYYSFYAFFNNVAETPGGTYTNPPQIRVPDADQAPLHEDLKSRIAELERHLDADDPRMDSGQKDWEARTLARFEPAIEWRTIDVLGAMAMHGSVLEVLDDGSILAKGDAPVGDTYELSLKPGDTRIAAIRIEVLPHESHPAGGSGRGKDGRFILSELKMRLKTLSEHQDPPLIYFAKAETDLTQKAPESPRLFTPIPGGIDGVVADREKSAGAGGGAGRGFRGGWSIIGEETREPHEALLIPGEILDVNDSTILRVTLVHNARPYKTMIGRFRITYTADARVRDLMLPVNPKLWSVLGPFPAADVTKAFAAEFDPEKDIAAGLDLEKKYTQPVVEEEKSEQRPAAKEGEAGTAPQQKTKPQKELVWSERRRRDGRAISLDGRGHVAWYLTRKIESTRARTAMLELAGGAGVRVWVNGKAVSSKAPKERARTGGAAEPEKVRIGLREGTNELVAKVVYRGRSAKGRSRAGGGADDFAQYYGYGQRGNSFTFRIRAEGDDVLSHEVATALRRGHRGKTVRGHYRRHIDAVGRALTAELTNLRTELAKLERGMPTALVMEELEEPRTTRIFERGMFRTQGAVVTAAVPSALPPMAPELPRNRLGLARWLTSGEHPLTARAAVNRIWQRFFGVGLVRTSGDFGIRGELPRHRKLLDWLAVEFVESGWDVKAMHELIVKSAAYRRSAHVTAEMYEADPDNRRYARGPRLRLAAEVVRDNALAVSGLLVEKLGGPSVKPFQPAGLWRAQSGRTSYEQDHGAGQYRRGLYVYRKRAVQYPSMAIFDAPKADTCTVSRDETTTPLQALVLLNDPVFVETAKMFAARILQEGGSNDEERLTYGFRSCTSRKPVARELELLSELLAEHRKDYAADPEAAKKFLGVGDAKVSDDLDPVEVAAWGTVASALLNLDATIHN